MIIALYIAVVLTGYLLGSIPFGLLIGKMLSRKDIRQVGSGKTGATNVLRTAGKKAAALVLILDIAKGALAAYLAGLIFTSSLLAGDPGVNLTPGAKSLAAFTAMLGHNWPVFTKFRGGRGVATFFGGLAFLNPPAALFGSILLFIIAFLTKYMSVGSMSGAVSTWILLIPLVIIRGTPVEYLAYAIIGAIFIIVMHRDNISRLLAGKERKLGEKVE